MRILTALVAGVAFASLGGALSAQNTPAPRPAPAAARPAGFPQPEPLGDGPWDVQTWDAKLHVEVVTKGLDHPWGMAFVPGGGTYPSTMTPASPMVAPSGSDRINPAARTPGTARMRAASCS